MYLVDTSAWIEILRGTQKGRKCAELIYKHNSFTIGIVIAEISKWCWVNKLDVNAKVSQVEALCGGIIEADRVSHLRAGFLWAEANRGLGKKDRPAGLIDCLIAAIAEENDLTVITKDRHFTRFTKIRKEFL